MSLRAQNNGASLAGYGMVASWGLGVLVAIYTFIALCGARHGQRRGGVSLTALTKWCALFAIGVVVATTVSAFVQQSCEKLLPARD